MAAEAKIKEKAKEEVNADGMPLYLYPKPISESKYRTNWAIGVTLTIMILCIIIFNVLGVALVFFGFPLFLGLFGMIWYLIPYNSKHRSHQPMSESIYRTTWAIGITLTITTIVFCLVMFFYPIDFFIQFWFVLMFFGFPLFGGLFGVIWYLIPYNSKHRSHQPMSKL